MSDAKKIVKIENERVLEITRKLNAWCAAQGFSNFETYVAMTYITKAMEEEFGFGVERPVDA